MFIVLAITVLFRKITKGLLTQNGFNCYITSATGRVFHIMYISPNLFTSHIKLYFHPGPCFIRLLWESLLLSCVAEKFDSFRFPSVPFRSLSLGGMFAGLTAYEIETRYRLRLASHECDSTQHLQY
jgi:hypothetical protein